MNYYTDNKAETYKCYGNLNSEVCLEHANSERRFFFDSSFNLNEKQSQQNYILTQGKYLKPQTDMTTVNSNQVYIPPKSMELSNTFYSNKMDNRNLITTTVKNCMTKHLLSSYCNNNKNVQTNDNILSKINLINNKYTFQSSIHLNQFSKIDNSNETNHNMLQNHSYSGFSSDTKSLHHSETFTKINPYVAKVPISNVAIQSKFIENDTNMVINKPVLNQENTFNRSNQDDKMCSRDKEVDTDDLEYFVQSSSKKDCQTQDSDGTRLLDDELLKHSKVSPNIVTATSKSSQCCINKNIQDLPKIKQNSQQDLNSMNAVDIRDMLNNLLNDLERNRIENNTFLGNETDNSSCDLNLSQDSPNSHTDICKLCDDLPKTYAKLCNRALDNVSSECVSSSSNDKNVENSINDDKISTKSWKFRNSPIENSSTQSQQQIPPTVAPLVKSKPSLHTTSNEIIESCGDIYKNISIRAFSVDPFDELVKSHLSPTDRRLKAISNKVDCNIKVAGPISSNNALNSRMKILYHCYLIGNCKDTVDKCLKCLQDSFPLMKLNEINVPSSLYSH